MAVTQTQLHDQEPPVHQENHGGAINSARVGPLLRAARERLGEDLRSVAAVLCIRYVHLQAIEQGSYSSLPGQAYAVGFVRAYATHLGLDADEVVRRFKLEATGIQAPSELDFPAPVSERTLPGLRLVAVGLVLAGLAYGGWLVVSTSDGEWARVIPELPDRLARVFDGGSDRTTPGPTANPPSPAGQPPSQQASASGLGVSPPVAPPMPSTTPPRVEAMTSPSPPDRGAAVAAIQPPPMPAAEPPADPAARAEATGDDPDVPPTMPEGALPKAPEPPAAETQTAALPAAPSKEPRIVIRATDDSWVYVREGSNRLMNTLMKPGDTYKVPDRPDIFLMTGNAGGIELVVDGTKLPPLGGTGVVVRGVRMDPDALLSQRKSTN